MAIITVHSSQDGYLYGAEFDMALRDKFWHPAGDSECSPCELSLWEIDDYGDAEVITRHGTSDQYHSDGYECMNYLRIIGREIK